MVRFKYKPTKVDYGEAKRKSKALPNKSMHIDEMVRRYARGLEIDVVQKTPIYSEQDEHDLEQISRMDFAQKAAFAAEQQALAKAKQAELAAIEATKRAKKKAQEAAERDKARASGIGSLDNTMPVDTSLSPKKLRKRAHERDDDGD